jgi:DNA end-binding protein Ku
VYHEDIIKGYQVDKGQYLEVTKEELENIALESTRTIKIDGFVPLSEIDDLYLVRRITSYQMARWAMTPSQ